MAGMHNELSDLKYEYDKAVRLRDNLQKNLDRKKKLNLADAGFEDDVKYEIQQVDEKISEMRSKIRRLESEATRAKVISETNERSPWEK